MAELLRHGDADPSVLDAIAREMECDPGLALSLRGELEFDEWIRCALESPAPSGEGKWREMESVFGAELNELIGEAEDGSLSRARSNRLGALLLDCGEEQISSLRIALAGNEWLREALDPAKGEEAFLEALETRMWAETKSDHFVEDFTKRLEQEIAVREDQVIPMPVSWKWQAAKMAGVAAVVAVGAFLVMQSVASRMLAPGQGVATVMKSSPDVVWGPEGQPGGGGLIQPGSYQLERGVVSLRFDSGAELTVEGPARFNVGKDEETFVYHGVALAKAAPSREPLKIRSRGLTVSRSVPLIGIDARSEHATEAVIFSGDGGVCLDEGECRSLFAKEAIKADLHREKLLDIPYNPQPFSNAWALASGVVNNLGPVKIELPGSRVEANREEEKVQVFVENESFRPEEDLEVDQVRVGQFASAENNPGESLHATGELRSYLLQVWSGGERTAEGEVEASLTFDYPVVGVIFSSDRLANSDQSVGTLLSEHGEDFNRARGLDSGSDEFLLSDDRKTLNLRLQSGARQVDQVRVLVALN